MPASGRARLVVLLSMRVKGAMPGAVRLAKRSSEIPSSVTTKAAAPSLEKTTALGL
jgi:hypothetical protein